MNPISNVNIHKCHHTHDVSAPAAKNGASSESPPLNFEKSPTIHYVKEWLDEFSGKMDSIIKNINDDIAELEAKGPERFFFPEDYEKRKNELKSNLSSRLDLKNELNKGYEIQTEDQLKKMLTTFFKLHNHRDLDDHTWEIFWPMLERETKLADDYYVMYTAHDLNREVKMLENHVKDSGAGHTCSQECFSKKTFRNRSELEYKTIEEAFLKHIFNPNFINDHSEKMTAHFICTSLSLFANEMSAESSMTRFCSKYSIDHRVDTENNPALQSRIEGLKNLEHGILEQICVRKDVAANLGYVSAPYGFPLSSDLNSVKKSSVDILDSFQQNKEVDLKAIDSPFIINTNQLESSGEYIGAAPRSSQQFLEDKTPGFKNLQFRLMYNPDLFNDGSSVLVFSHTLDDHSSNQKLESILNCKAQSQLTINKVNNYLSK